MFWRAFEFRGPVRLDGSQAPIKRPAGTAVVAPFNRGSPTALR